MSPQNCLVLGASGAIGTAVKEVFASEGYEVWTTGRSSTSHDDRNLQINGNVDIDSETFTSAPQFHAVIWAQGVNLNDSILTFDLNEFHRLMNANVDFVVMTLRALLISERLAPQARLCVVSSIWQEIIRTNKMSYAISKAAIGAFIKSTAIDLAPRGFLINGVLPGVLDTPMTRSVLSVEAMKGVEDATGFSRLVTPNEIAKTAVFLCSSNNSAITGQSLIVDLGFSNARSI
jgi:NAD(P)-dependent dehydrogenase (short-subunit alcohol dehydrogenase family)